MLKWMTLSLLLLLSTKLSQAQVPCSLDNTFDTDGRLISDGSRIGQCIVDLPDGSALVAYNPFGNSHAYIRHILIDGSVDPAYGTAGKTTLQVASLRTDIQAMLLLNNELYICGNTGTGSNTYAFVSKLKSNGVMDVSFGNAGLSIFSTYFTFNDMVYNPVTNKLIVAGMKGTQTATIACMNTNGLLDTGFGNLGSTEVGTGNSSIYYQINDIQIDKAHHYLLTGKYYTTMGTGTFTKLVVMRFDSNGNLDTGFDSDGLAFYNSQSSGSHEEGRRIFANSVNEYYICGSSYVNGSDWNYAVLKIKNDGSTQNAFGTNGWKIYDLTNQGETETILNAEMMSNENLLLTGNQGSGDTVHFAMLMIKPDGSRDHTFSPNGLFLNIFGNNNNSSSYGLAITTEGKIYLGGYTRTCTGGTCGPLYMGIARYTGAPFPTWTNTVIPDNSYMVFPNPVLSDGYFQLKLNAAEAGNCYAWNLSGQTIPVQKINSTVYRLQNAVPGQYLLQHVTNNGRVQYARMLLK